MQDHKRSSAILQQSLARLLGRLDYLAFENGLSVALPCLIEVLDKNVGLPFLTPNEYHDVKTSSIQIISEMWKPAETHTLLSPTLWSP